MKSRILLVIVGVSGGGCPLAMSQATFQGVGFLSEFGEKHSEAYAVSDDGTVVAGTGGSDFASEAFIWTAQTGIVGLGNPGDGSRVNDVSGDGRVVVGWASGPATWTAESGWTGLDLGGDADANATTVDGAMIVGETSTPDNPKHDDEACLWTAESGMVRLGFLPDGGFSSANAVSADGAVIAGVARAKDNHSRAFRWTPELGMVSLGTLPGSEGSHALGISADGAVVVGQSKKLVGQAFRWTDETGITSLGTLNGDIGSLANAASADGNVIVGTSWDAEQMYHAFVWTASHGMRGFAEALISAGVDLTGWTLERVTDVSLDGTMFVGYGVDPEGHHQGWIAHLPLACPADCDGSGGLDLFDFLCFTNLFNAKNPAADCVADGAFDLFDFLCFVNQFNAGC